MQTKSEYYRNFPTNESQVSWEMGAFSNLHKDYKLVEALFCIPGFPGPPSTSTSWFTTQPDTGIIVTLCFS